MDLVIGHLFMKLFKSNNNNTVSQCQQFSYFELRNVAVTNKTAKCEQLLYINCSRQNACLIRPIV